MQLIRHTTPFISSLNYVAASALGVDMNAVADTALTIALPPGVTRFRIQNLLIWGASVAINAATQVQYALYTAAAAGGTAIISPTASTISATAADAANSAHYISPSAHAFMEDTSLFFRVTTAHGAAATANVAIQVQALPG